MKKTGYRWWKNRFRCILESVDIIRVDHFRGFEAYWAVNAGEETAVNGEWIKGPADDLFEAIEAEFGSLPIIAEDLGLITDEVNELKDRLALPGMRLLHFYLQHDENGTAYFECAPNTIAYTGTHDNNTTAGWYEENLSEYERAGLRKMLKVSDDATPEEICDKLIEYLYKCNASTVIVPMQDILRLGSKSRMNTPGSFGGANWHWRLAADYYKKSDTARLAKLVCDTGRQKSKAQMKVR
jgi:4-alpha-glucanotransferase